MVLCQIVKLDSLPVERNLHPAPFYNRQENITWTVKVPPSAFTKPTGGKGAGASRGPIKLYLELWSSGARRPDSQVVRQRSAKPLSGVRFPLGPQDICKISGESKVGGTKVPRRGEKASTRSFRKVGINFSSKKN